MNVKEKKLAVVLDDDVLCLPVGDWSWVVLHCRPRCEKKVVQVCDLKGWPTYLPLRTKVHRYGGRERVFSTPLFPGYVFCVTTAPGKTFLRQNRYVANLLEVFDQARLVEQLKQVRRALDVADSVEVMPYLEKGKLVRVLGGPFKGLEGIVARVKGKTRVVINVDMIRQAVAVEVDAAYVGPG